MSILPKKPLSRLAQIEITISVIIVLILISLGVLIYHNHIKKVADNKRERTVRNLAQELEVFYLKDGRGFYPPLANLQNGQWTSENLSKDVANFKIGHNQDDADYVYTSRDVSNACQNPDPVVKLTAGCVDFKLTIKLSDGEQYTQLSRNEL